MSEIDVRVRVYEMIDGEPLSPMLDFPLSSIGVCPNVGDTLCLDMPTIKFYSVSRRYYVKMTGWAVIVREVAASAQANGVMRAWQEDDEWDAQIEAEERAEQDKARRRADELRELISGKPPEEFAFDYWEEPVMQRLAKIGVGKHVRIGTIKGLGATTRKKLVSRGFITIQSGKPMGRNDLVSLTSDGAKAWRALLAYRKKVEAAKSEWYRQFII